MPGIASEFSGLMTDFTNYSDRLYQYLYGNQVQRYWMVPTITGILNPTDIAALGNGFDRSQLHADYSAEHADNGQRNKAMGYSIQINYLGMMERAFRERHRTPTRALMLLAGRKRAHSDPAGVPQGSVLAYVNDLFGL